MCNLYSHKKSQAEIRGLFPKLKDSAGNLQPQPAIFPDGIAPVIRNTKDGLELIKMRWGIPGPAIFGGKAITNIRNTKSGFWKPMLKPECRCLVPATSFCEYNDKPDPKTRRKTPIWFALSDRRPLFFFAGVWKEWTGTRGTKADPVTGKHLLYSFLTTDSNKIVAPVHAKAMPVMLSTKKEWEIWLRAPIDEALELQRPLPDRMLKIVASGEKKD
jgi:putative SOS response-associated peptidase YedK